MIPIDRLVSAYTSGWFPMAVEGSGVRWFSPDPRGIIPLERFHVSRRLHRLIRRRTFDILVDRSFDQVIRACAEANRDGGAMGTWIDAEIYESYCALHRAGYAHSVEAWTDGRLVGGLYGVAIAGAFFGESMFHYENDASKAALVGLVDRLRARGYTLLDTQWITPHLEQFGAIEVPRRRYLQLLADALRRDCSFL